MTVPFLWITTSYYLLCRRIYLFFDSVTIDLVYVTTLQNNLKSDVDQGFGPDVIQGIILII